MNINIGDKSSSDSNSGNNSENINISDKSNSYKDFLIQFNEKNPYKTYSFYTAGVSGISVEEYEISKVLLRKNAMMPAQSPMVLRNLLYQVKKKGERIEKQLKETMEKDIQTIFSDFENFDIQYNSAKNQLIKVHIINQDNSKIPLDLMGTGFLQIVQMLTIKYLYEPKIIILDEPDAHLHPAQQLALFNLLEKWAILENRTTTTNLQILISTHSKTIINKGLSSNYKKYYNINFINNNTSKEIFNGKSKQKYSENILTEIWESIGEQQEYIVLTEDSESGLLYHILDKNNFDMNKIRIITSSGKDKLNVFASTIKEFFPNMKILIHRDIDDTKKEILDTFEENINDISTNDKNDCKVWFTDDYKDGNNKSKVREIEGYIIKTENIEQQLSGAYGSAFDTLSEIEKETYMKEAVEQALFMFYKNKESSQNKNKKKNSKKKTPAQLAKEEVQKNNLEEAIQSAMGKNIQKEILHELQKVFNKKLKKRVDIINKLHFELPIEKLQELGKELGMLKDK